jgi:hypothetical protein
MSVEKSLIYLVGPFISNELLFSSCFQKYIVWYWSSQGQYTSVYSFPRFIYLGIAVSYKSGCSHPCEICTHHWYKYICVSFISSSWILVQVSFRFMALRKYIDFLYTSLFYLCSALPIGFQITQVWVRCFFCLIVFAIEDLLNFSLQTLHGSPLGFKNWCCFLWQAIQYVLCCYLPAI